MRVRLLDVVVQRDDKDILLDAGVDFLYDARVTDGVDDERVDLICEFVDDGGLCCHVVAVGKPPDDAQAEELVFFLCMLHGRHHVVEEGDALGRHHDAHGGMLAPRRERLADGIRAVVHLLGHLPDHRRLGGIDVAAVVQHAIDRPPGYPA